MKSKRRLLIIIAFWFAVITFSYIAGEVLERQPLYFDKIILTWIHAHSSYLLDDALLIVTIIGNAEIIAPLTLLICGLLAYRKHYQEVKIVLYGFFGAAAANVVLKFLFHRQRPNFWHSSLQETGYSFPSGHAMMSSALVFALIAALWNTRFRWIIIAFGIPFAAVVGYSRLYLGVHYPTDIIAGWLASLAWVSLIIFLQLHKIRVSKFVAKFKR